MTPSAWQNGGAGVTIRWTVVDTSLGKLLVAATDQGLCRLAFDADLNGGSALDLARRFPQAEVVAGGAALAELAAQVVAAVETPGRDHDLPLDVQGIAFQERIWRVLKTSSAGQRSDVRRSTTHKIRV